MMNITCVCNRLQSYIKKVGLPDVYKRQPETIKARAITKNYLSTLFDSILLKDVAKRHKVRNTTDLYNICLLYTSNTIDTYNKDVEAENAIWQIYLANVAAREKLLGEQTILADSIAAISQSIAEWKVVDEEIKDKVCLSLIHIYVWFAAVGTDEPSAHRAQFFD